jgi:hypothetical protein
MKKVTNTQTNVSGIIGPKKHAIQIRVTSHE